jgi:hypothetical protein
MMPGALAFPPLWPGSTAMIFPNSGLAVPALGPGGTVLMVGAAGRTVLGGDASASVDGLVLVGEPFGDKVRAPAATARVVVGRLGRRAVAAGVPGPQELTAMAPAPAWPAKRSLT